MNVCIAALVRALAVAQTRGPRIIELLHGAEAKRAALAFAPVLPDSRNLCAEYEAAHFDATSDVLHGAGMLAAILLVLKSPRQAVLWGPPVYYLPAWAGHFVFQRDIPAVFSYGTTWRGWWAGESCAWRELLAGRALTTPRQWMVTAVPAMVAVRLVTAGKNHGGAQKMKEG